MSFIPSDPRAASMDAVEEKWRRSPAPTESKEGSEAFAESDAGASTKNKCSLRYFEASMFATILEDTITQLRILSECNNELRVTKTNTDIGKLRAKKYSVKQPAVLDELEGVNRSNLTASNYKLDKLDNDKKLVTAALLSVYLDLARKKSWKALDDKNKEILDEEKRRVDLAEEEAKNKATRRDLARQLRQQRNHIKSVTYETDGIIAELKTQVEDAALNAEIRGRYVENWQRARSEQHSQKISDVERKPSDAIEHYKQSIDREQRVHTEVELLINININETLRKVESWMNKFDADIEKLDIKIQKMKHAHENMLDKRHELERTLERHDQLIKDWVKFKDDREEARLYVEKMHKSAGIVQAWWRGLLVRMQLGPYKPTKQPPKPEKPAKGKGKKK